MLCYKLIPRECTKCATLLRDCTVLTGATLGPSPLVRYAFASLALQPNEIEDGVTFGSYLKLPSATGDTLVITDNTDKTTLVPAGDDVCFEGGCPSDRE